jgi:hypothetical protein
MARASTYQEKIDFNTVFYVGNTTGNTVWWFCQHNSTGGGNLELRQTIVAINKIYFATYTVDNNYFVKNILFLKYLRSSCLHCFIKENIPAHPPKFIFILSMKIWKTNINRGFSV